ncbi:DUF1833 domain-containing protein [Aureimonas altamirensis]|uniref:DUF1833 family protein n=1 Tax=Aureimonas altamirensis TaxID=370622 RepID=UPI002036F364|nr:DUF1833 family protein [Aureimonas altamirensis]MCM2506060.1 DUF1833 domain-containing protein [Aureimonas altamirensis]
MRNLSSKMRFALTAQGSGEVAITLLTIYDDLLSEPIRVCDHATTLIDDSPETWATISRGRSYQYVPFQLALPDDKSERAPASQIQIANTNRELVELLRTINNDDAPTTIMIEVVTLSTPDVVEIPVQPLDINRISFDAVNVTIGLSADSYSDEPFPAGEFRQAGFPGLFS